MKFFTVVLVSLFFLGDGFAETSRPYQSRRARQAAAAQPAVAQTQSTPTPEIKSPDGRPIFYPRQVSSFVLNTSFYGGYGRNRIPTFPASNDPLVQAGHQTQGPQLLWEAFMETFQNTGHVRSLNNAVQAAQGRRYRSGGDPVVAVSYPVPDSRSKDVWYVIASGMINQTEDKVKAGPSVLAQILADIVEVGGRHAGRRTRGTTGDLIREGSRKGERILRSVRKDAMVAKLKLDLTIQFENASSGDILTFTGENSELFRVVDGSTTFLLGRVNGRLEQVSLKDAIEQGMAKIRPQFEANWRYQDLRPSQQKLAEVKAENVDLDRDIAAERELRGELEKAQQKRAELGKVKVSPK